MAKKNKKPPKPTRRDWYTEADDDRDEVHPVDKAVSLNLKADRDFQATSKRARRLQKDVVALLHGKDLKRFLRLEETLNKREYDRCTAYYNMGVDDGLAKRVVDDVLDDAKLNADLAPLDALKALVQAAAKVATRL